MKTIMVDMDDVITDGNIDKFIEEFLGEKINYDSHKSYYKQDFIKDRLEEFRKIYQYQNIYENAPLKEGCYEVLKKLNEKYDVYIVTSYIWRDEIIDTATNLKNKFEYLQKQLPFISPSKYIFADDKTKMHFDIGIDDRPHNLVNVDKKILFSSYSNQNLEEELVKENIIRARDWYDVLRIIEGS